MKLTVGMKIGASFALTLVIIVIIGISSSLALNKMREAVYWTNHSFQVLHRLDDVTSMMKDAETGQRGFIITGDPHYLAPYNDARDKIAPALEEIAKLTVDNPRQQQRIVVLKGKSSVRLALLTEAITVREEKGFEAARKAILANNGKTVMDEIRKTADDMHTDEITLMGQRSTKVATTIFLANSTIVGGLLLTFVLLVVMNFLLNRSIARPMNALALVIERIAGRDDLNVSIPANNSQDEVGKLTQAFRQMLENLRRSTVDLSEGKRLEEELRAASLYTRNLIEASLDPLVTINPAGKITDVNHTTEQVTGVTREVLIGSDFADFFTEPDKARAGYQQVFSQGIVKDYPLTIRHTSGRTTDVLYNASVYKNAVGAVQGVFAAARDVTERMRLDEELKTYREQLEGMVEKRTAELTSMLKDVKETANVLAASSSEILVATTQVASGTAEAATAINETTTTVEEVRQAARLSSDKAMNVSDSARRVAQVAQSGQQAVEGTAASMLHIRDQMESIAQTIVRLSEQSQSIGGIIASVTDLADQSNLLAVNAAIEAARAGEQGKGFAVVAQEIKSLAEQSKQATIQVRGILSDVQKATGAAVMATEQGSKAVEAGVKQSAQAGEAIRVLAESTGEAAQVATQIVSSSQQQVVGMDQIGVAMENINQAGAQTAASMQQAETAAQNLHELGQRLKELVEQSKA
jgi:PAS domain S-box-containing protein